MEKHLNFATEVGFLFPLGNFVGFSKREYVKANYSKTLWLVRKLDGEISYIVFLSDIPAIQALSGFCFRSFRRRSQTKHLEQEGSCCLLGSRKQSLFPVTAGWSVRTEGEDCEQLLS